jgi:ABC-type branched-subunit amino acid transport system ATPase component/ABC-type branched-subunit amino acid transport system permease subunit
VFVAVGGYGVALLGPGGTGLPLGLAAAIALLLAAALGYLTALSFLWLDGAYFALATWTLAWLAQRVLVAFPDAFGGSEGLTRPVPMHLVSRTLGADLVLTGKVNLCLAAGLCVVVVLALVRIGNGPAGLDLAALRESPELAASLGVPTASRRRMVLAATAALGAASGVGSTVLLGVISPSDVSPLLSLQLFVAVILAGSAHWWGPVVGVALISALPPATAVIADLVGFHAAPLQGVLTAALMVGAIGGRELLRRRPGVPQPRAWALPVAGPRSDPATQERSVSLEVAHARASYAGVLALDDVSLLLRGGQVGALVGPNGSGKSTLLKVLAGEAGTGEVRIDGKPHRARSVQDRVRVGVVRTSQRATVLAGITPAQQVALAALGAGRSRQVVARHLFATPRSRLDEDRVRATAAAALRDTGLTHLGDIDPIRLSVGERQLLQIARAVATGASVLLLDEPAAGMTPGERDALRSVLRGLAASGSAILVVEHDMLFVGSVADWVTVLDAGRIIAAGKPGSVQADPAVREAFLGTA